MFGGVSDSQMRTIKEWLIDPVIKRLDSMQTTLQTISEQRYMDADKVNIRIDSLQRWIIGLVVSVLGIVAELVVRSH